MIDIALAMESVVEAVGHEMLPAQPGRDVRAQRSLAEQALALVVPSARRPGAARAVVAELRRDPLAAAESWDCTFGAVVVWRAVDRAEQDGASWFAAAEAGLTSALRYADLLPESLATGLGREELLRYATVLLLELASRLALLQSSGALDRATASADAEAIEAMISAVGAES